MTVMHDCPLCGSGITGRNANEVWFEYRDMVRKAQAAEALHEAASSFANQADLYLTPPRNQDDEPRFWRRLRADLRAELRELQDAVREYRKTRRGG